MIIMWSGSIASIPSGWALCNGSNGTPDLRDRFVVGAGSSYAVAATGGSKDAIVVSHTHTASTNSAGAATGSITATVGDFGSYQTGSASGVFSVSGSSFPSRMQGAAGTGSRPTVDMSIAAHSHTVTVNSTGSSGTNANLPPYYALAFIMKL
jgi:microcystin-dependent protein